MYGHIPFKYIETVFGHSFRWINPHNTRFIITENVYGFIILHSFFYAAQFSTWHLNDAITTIYAEDFHRAGGFWEWFSRHCGENIVSFLTTSFFDSPEIY